LCLLRLGRHQEGWRDYEQRFAAGAVHQALPSTPRWGGDPARHLLIVAEQGLGDTILFARFLPEAARRAEQLTFACPESLAGLLGRSLGVRCVPQGPQHWPQHDEHLPLMSLPHVLGLGTAALQNQPAYLKPDPARRARWAQMLESPSGAPLRIGLVHCTSVAHSTEENPWTRRSCRAADLEPVTCVAGVVAYNLNLGRAAEQARMELPALQDLPAALSDFDDTAAVVDLMDAVIGVDTATAHAAGAIGKAAFLLLPSARDWRWMAREGRLPWYPCVEAFAQQHPGEWREPVLQLRATLEARVGQSSFAATIRL
jgi:hypothetical protein